MARTVKERSKDHTAHDPGFTPRQPFTLAWRSIFIATVPVSLAAYYLSWVAPSLVPVPEAKQLFPDGATEFIEDVCLWCGETRWAVVLIAVVLIVAGGFYRLVAKKERYYRRLAILVSLGLALVYLTISTPLGRLDEAVDEAIPVDRRVPVHGEDK